jgi:transposase
MRQVREVLRLKFVGGVPTREIARRIGIAPSTVRTTIRRFQAAGLSWPVNEEITDAALEAKLFPETGSKQGHRRESEPDWASIHRELKRKHVTLSILWDEYIACNPEGYRYSRFCELYRIWEGKLSVTMRQTHLGGDKLFVDYAGDTVPVIIDRLTGETRPAQIFVAVMGASNFTYVEATWTQTLCDWIGAHTRALAAIGGVPHLIVPDNAKVAVIKACLYEPQVNRTYAEMAAHYATAILPTRPRRPRDKAKVEACVLIVERWLIGRLCEEAAMASTPRSPITCPPVTAVTPTGPSAGFKEMPLWSGRQRRGCAISFWSAGRTPNRASDPASAFSAWPERSASHVWKPPPRAPSRSARSPMARSAPFSTTSSIDTPHPRGPRTARRSSIPTFAARVTTIRRMTLAHTSDTRSPTPTRVQRDGQSLRRDRSIR